MLKVGLVAFLTALGLLAAAPAAWAQEVVAGHYTLAVEFRPAPPVVGQAHLRVRVAAHGSPVERAAVQATLDMPAMPGAHAATVKLEAVSPGTYEARVDFAMAGEWQIVFSVDGPMGQGQATMKVQVASGAASPPPAGRTLSAGPYTLRVALEPDPPGVGDNRVQVWVEAQGQSVEGAAVRVKADMPGMPMALPEVRLDPEGGGGYSGTLTLSMAGLWQLDFFVEGSRGRGEGSLRLEAVSEAASPGPTASPEGPYRVTLTTRPDPPVVGDLPARIEVRGTQGQLIEGARVFAGVEMPGMQARPRPLQAREAEPGVYQVVLPLSMEGLWKVTVEVDGPQGRQERVFNLLVARGGLPRWLPGTVAALVLGAFLLWRMARGGRVTAGGALVVLLLVGTVVLATWYADRHRPPDTSMGMKMDMAAPDMGMSAADVNSAVPVALEEVRPGRLDETVTYSATVAPLVEETVYPRVEGWLSEAPFYAGDRVQAGQVLARLESPELQSRLAVARAGTRVARLRQEQVQLGQARRLRMVEQARAQVEAARQEMRVAQEEVNATEVDLRYKQGVYERERQLFEAGASSKEELDMRLADYEAARVQHHHAQVMVEKARAELAAAEAGLGAARLEHAEARAEVATAGGEVALSRAEENTEATMAGFTVLYARTDGVITRRMVDPGVLVGPGMGIYQVARIDQVRVRAQVAEQDLARLAGGMAVRITSPALAEPLEARITSLFHAVDPQSRTGVAEALVVNPGQKLLPGAYAVMEIYTRRLSGVLTVPARALVSYYGKPAVWIAQKRAGALVAAPRLVQTGARGGGRVEIVSGLAPGEKVIWAGQDRLTEGTPVVPGRFGEGPYRELLLPAPPPGASTPGRGQGGAP